MNDFRPARRTLFKRLLSLAEPAKRIIQVPWLALEASGSLGNCSAKNQPNGLLI
jgi:hypothetical protein